MKRTLIFDFDGTLHNHLALYARAVREEQRILKEEGIESREYTDEEMGKWLGMTAAEMWNDFMPGLTQERKDIGAKNISRRLSEGIMRRESVLYPNAETVMNRLKEMGYGLILLSNCSQKHMDANVSAFELGRWFDMCVSSGAYPGESKAQIFEHIKNELENPCCVIGDRASDFEVAKVHGLKFIACRYGFGCDSEFVGADAFLNDISELPQVLDSLGI